jgi:DNA-binding response OmpR family regulator
MLKVLIAEDDLLIADMTEELLAAHGYDVCGIGRTVSEALALAWCHKPDLAIVDVRLADGDLGTQFAAGLTGLRHLGILYVTGNVAAVSSNDVHGHGHLAKPYRPGDLLRSLEIVTEMIESGTAIPPFPPSFHVLPSAGMRDSTDSGENTARVKTLRWQQSVLAGFGRYVPRQDELAPVLTEAVRVSAEGLRTPYCTVHRYRPAPDDLLREAAFGWHGDVAGDVVLRADVRTSEGRAFVTRTPVICNALRDAIDFSRPASQAARRALSTVHVIIKGDDGRPYGVLGASNNAGQDYAQHDVDFLNRVADIVAVYVAGLERTATRNRTIEGLLPKVESGHRTPDQQSAPGEQRSAWAGDGAPPAIGNLGELTNLPPTNTGTHRAAAKAAHAVLAARAISDHQHGRAVPHVVSRDVLIIEDDVLLRDILAENFAAQPGFTVLTAGTLAEADRILVEKDHHFDTIVLDIRLPDGDGCDYCRGLRHKKHEMPIIMLTGRNDEADVVRGLNSGANDYVAKPFIWNELFARVRAHLRLYDDSEGAAFAIGPYVFRPARKVLQDVARNRRIALTRMEAAVLKFLYRWGPSVVDRDVLAKEVWGADAHVTTHTLDTHVYRLRQKIETNPNVPTLLLSARGGYRLNFEPASP